MNKELLKIGLVFGGISREHEVSINSARTIIKSLRESSNSFKYKVISIYIDQEGKWHSNNYSEEILENINPKNKNLFDKQFTPNDLSYLLDQLKEIDIWFPILHGPNGEDGTIQGFFKLTQKPFVGSAVLGSALGLGAASISLPSPCSSQNAANCCS